MLQTSTWRKEIHLYHKLGNTRLVPMPSLLRGKSPNRVMFLLYAQYSLYQLLSTTVGTDTWQGRWWGCEVEDEAQGEHSGGFVADTYH